MTIKELCADVRDMRETKGFYTPSTIEGTNGDFMLGKLMLVVTEIAEAAEAVRSNDIENFKEELADATIRIFDICGTMGIDLEEEIVSKMKINATRPIRHGRETTL